MPFFDTSRSARHRSRLSHADVKLILYLIVEIKPFKYVGDRTLLQSRKWDLIQQRLEQYKLKHTASFPVVPTVRTLQRQMATALRNAQRRQKSDSTELFQVFQNLSKNSPLEDLEHAVLELYNLSEAYKTGQTMGPLPDAVHKMGDPDELPVQEEDPDSAEESGEFTADGFVGPPVDLESDENVPESVAHIVQAVRKVMEQNRNSYNEAMTMLRMQLLAMNERCLHLEQLIMLAARENKLPNNKPAKSSTDDDDDAPRSGMTPQPATSLRSLLQLLN